MHCTSFWYFAHLASPFLDPNSVVLEYIVWDDLLKITNNPVLTTLRIFPSVVGMGRFQLTLLKIFLALQHCLGLDISISLQFSLRSCSFLPSYSMQSMAFTTFLLRLRYMREGIAFHLLTKHNCYMILNRDRTIAATSLCNIFNASFFAIPFLRSSRIEPRRGVVIGGGDNTDL